MRDVILARRIMARCVERKSGCIEWTGHRLPTGYGQIRVSGTTQQVHRALWIAMYGEIAAGLVVMHKCDNPPCVNMGHLKLGTKADNSADTKGRSVRMTNERSGKSKLTDAQVAEMRDLRSNGVGCREIGRRFGISHSHVSRMSRGLRRPAE